MEKLIAAQGEIYIYEIESMPQNLDDFSEYDKQKRPIISHSESGNNHVIEGDVLVKEETLSDGMRTFYAIAKSPHTALIQDASHAHETIALDEGKTYKFVIAREYDPWSKQIQRVMD